MIKNKYEYLIDTQLTKKISRQELTLDYRMEILSIERFCENFSKIKQIFETLGSKVFNHPFIDLMSGILIESPASSEGFKMLFDKVFINNITKNDIKFGNETFPVNKKVTLNSLDSFTKSNVIERRLFIIQIFELFVTENKVTFTYNEKQITINEYLNLISIIYIGCVSNDYTIHSNLRIVADEIMYNYSLILANKKMYINPLSKLFNLIFNHRINNILLAPKDLEFLPFMNKFNLETTPGIILNKFIYSLTDKFLDEHLLDIITLVDNKIMGFDYEYYSNKIKECKNYLITTQFYMKHIILIKYENIKYTFEHNPELSEARKNTYRNEFVKFLNKMNTDLKFNDIEKHLISAYDKEIVNCLYKSTEYTEWFTGFIDEITFSKDNVDNIIKLFKNNEEVKELINSISKGIKTAINI